MDSYNYVNGRIIKVGGEREMQVNCGNKSRQKANNEWGGNII